VTQKETEETHVAPLTPSGEANPEKDPSFLANKEKVVEAETLKFGAETPAATPDAPVVDKSKEPAGPAISSFDKEASLIRESSHHHKGLHSSGRKLKVDIIIPL